MPRKSDQPARAPRQDTQLQATGAEFLVLGQLLIAGIPAFKSYTNLKGYDLTATNADRRRSVRVQVKSRWRTGAEGFLINRIDCDFVVVVLLNRGSRDGTAEVRPPEYFVIPARVVRALPRSESWGKVNFSQFPQLQRYRDRWDLVQRALGMKPPRARSGDRRRDE
jgi:hypothetical protein